MGAANFTATAYGKMTMQEAYDQLYEQARSEYGSDPYNGSISTTEGVVRSPISPAGPIREDQIDGAALDARMTHLGSRGVCEAIPVHQVSPAQYSRLGTTVADVIVPTVLFDPAQTTEQDRDNALALALVKAVRKQAKTEGTVPLEERQVVRNNPKTLAHPAKMDPNTLVVDYIRYEFTETKPFTKATQGKTETRYFIIRKGDGQMPKWDAGHLSQAAARAALPAGLPLSMGRLAGVVRYEIISMTRRATGDALVEHEVTALRGKTVKVRLRSSLSERTKDAEVTGTEGWYFYGWVAD